MRGKVFTVINNPKMLFSSQSIFFIVVGIKVIAEIILTMYLIAFKDVYELPFLSLETYKVLEKVGM